MEDMKPKFYATTTQASHHRPEINTSSNSPFHPIIAAKDYSQLQLQLQQESSATNQTAAVFVLPRNKINF